MLHASDGTSDLIFITVVPPQGISGKDGILLAYEELAEHLSSQKAELLHERAYGIVSIAGTVTQLRDKVLATIGKSNKVPQTFVEGTPFYNEVFAGIHAIAATQTEKTAVELVEKNGYICGRQFSGREAEYFFVSDVARMLPSSVRGNPTLETFKAIKLTNEILKERNWSYKDVRRTWFYLDDILDWYSDFNQTRNDIYKSMGLFNCDPRSIIPASTGIWGKNPEGCSCTLDVIAIRSLNDRPFQVSRLRNPQQNEATDYGSAFSRGVSITTERCKYIFVSGTASIDEQGKSVHPGDMRQQTIRTIHNVESLLQSAGAQLCQIQRATAFVKNREDIPIFEQEISRNGMPKIPIIRTIADVCRDELLFEFDAAAVIPL